MTSVARDISYQKRWLNPELLQPTVLAISTCYILTTIFIKSKLLFIDDGVILFTYHCGILSLLSGIIYYAKTNLFQSYKITGDWMYSILLIVIICLYINYTTVRTPALTNEIDRCEIVYSPRQSIQPNRKNTTGNKIPGSRKKLYQVNRVDYESLIGEAQFNNDNNNTLVEQNPNKKPDLIAYCNCIDKLKCSHPLHLTLQVALMGSILFSLMANVLLTYL